MNCPHASVLSIARIQAKQYLLVTCVVFIPLVGSAYTIPTKSIVQVEVFAVTHQVVGNEVQLHGTELHQRINLQFYELNGIQSVETELSKDLLESPEQSKRLALQRIQDLDSKTRVRLQQAATGLARAMSYGIDRYPAIVFDGQAVVYGVVNLRTALAHYQAWRIEAKP